MQRQIIKHIVAADEQSGHLEQFVGHQGECQPPAPPDASCTIAAAVEQTHHAGEEGKEGQPAPMQRAEEGKTETQRRIDGIGGFQKG